VVPASKPVARNPAGFVSLGAKNSSATLRARANRHFNFPRKSPAQVRIDLTGDPTPATKLDGSDGVLPNHAGRLMLKPAKLHPYRHRLWADHGYAFQAWRNHRRPRKHPKRGHQPPVWPGSLIKEGFKFASINLTISGSLDVDREATGSIVADQNVSPYKGSTLSGMLNFPRAEYLRPDTMPKSEC